MMCAHCLKLAHQQCKKACLRCKGDVFTNLSVICDTCSSKDQICSVCLKKIVLVGKTKAGGCGCGKK